MGAAGQKCFPLAQIVLRGDGGDASGRRSGGVEGDAPMEEYAPGAQNALIPPAQGLAGRDKADEIIAPQIAFHAAAPDRPAAIAAAPVLFRRTEGVEVRAGITPAVCMERITVQQIDGAAKRAVHLGNYAVTGAVAPVKIDVCAGDVSVISCAPDRPQCALVSGLSEAVNGFAHINSSPMM